MKKYGKRLRLSPKEERIVYEFRKGNVQLVKPSAYKQAAPKILLLDIETAPISALIFNLKTEYVNPSSLEDGANFYIISWAAKWLMDEVVMSDVLTSEEICEEDDSRIAGSMWHLVDEADVVISHNGRKFDHKMLNMRWLINDFVPPTPYKTIDTLIETKANFMLPSYKLDFIAKILGIGEKVKHEGMDMWKKAIRGDEDALKRMRIYNEGDVTVLEDLYLVIRPWIKNHPNFGLYAENETPVCHVCGSVHLTKENKPYVTSVSKFDVLRCDDCGSLSRQRQNSLPKEVKKALVTGIPGNR